MPNKLNIPETTLNQVVDSTSKWNNSKELKPPIIVRIKDHADNDINEVGTNASKMAIFTRKYEYDNWFRCDAKGKQVYWPGDSIGPEDHNYHSYFINQDKEQETLPEDLAANIKLYAHRYTIEGARLWKKNDDYNRANPCPF